MYPTRYPRYAVGQTVQCKRNGQQAKVSSIAEADDGMPICHVTFEPYGGGLGGVADEWRDDEVS